MANGHLNIYIYNKRNPRRSQGFFPIKIGKFPGEMNTFNSW